MLGKILIVAAGAAVGYVVGTKRGRRDFEMMKSKASGLWLDPRVQKVAGKAGGFFEEKVPGVGPMLSDAVDAATKAARDATKPAARPSAA